MSEGPIDKTTKTTPPPDPIPDPKPDVIAADTSPKLKPKDAKDDKTDPEKAEKDNKGPDKPKAAASKDEKKDPNLQLLEDLNQMVSDINGAINDALAAAAKEAGKKIADTPLGKALGGLKDAVTDKASEIATSLKDRASKKIDDAVDDVMKNTKVGEGLTALQKAKDDIIKKASDGIIDGINDATKKVKSIEVGSPDKDQKKSKDKDKDEGVELSTLGGAKKDDGPEIDEEDEEDEEEVDVEKAADEVALEESKNQNATAQMMAQMTTMVKELNDFVTPSLKGSDKEPDDEEDLEDEEDFEDDEGLDNVSQKGASAKPDDKEEEDTASLDLSTLSNTISDILVKAIETVTGIDFSKTSPPSSGPSGPQLDDQEPTETMGKKF